MYIRAKSQPFFPHSWRFCALARAIFVASRVNMMLTIKNDVRLKELTTFGIGGNARYFAEVATLDDLRDALTFAAAERLELLILGGGIIE